MCKKFKKKYSYYIFLTFKNVQLFKIKQIIKKEIYLYNTTFDHHVRSLTHMGNLNIFNYATVLSFNELSFTIKIEQAEGQGRVEWKGGKIEFRVSP